MATKKKENKNTSAVNTTAESVLQEQRAKQQDNKPVELMKKLGVKVLFENSKKEYFTEKSYALASEEGKAEKIKEHKL